jgi:DNA-binding transcriptional MerR regulator
MDQTPPSRVVRRYTITDLEDIGFSRRTIYYYVSTGVLPRCAGGRGRATYYTQEHVKILEAIRKQRESARTLDDFRDRLAMKREREEAKHGPNHHPTRSVAAHPGRRGRGGGWWAARR